MPTVTRQMVARNRERLLVDLYRHRGWPLPAKFSGPDAVFGQVAVAMMRRANRLLLPDRDPDVWSGELTRAIVAELHGVGAVALGIAGRFLGPMETGPNTGPLVVRVQAATDLPPGAWPYCAAGVFYCLREAGWRHAQAFRRASAEAAVVAWVQAARAEAFGLRVGSWESAEPGDLLAFDWTGRGDWTFANRATHMGFVRTPPLAALIGTREFNTGPGLGGNQGDGDGCWDRIRTQREAAFVVIRVER